jgi:hypothetical protein
MTGCSTSEIISENERIEIREARFGRGERRAESGEK